MESKIIVFIVVVVLIVLCSVAEAGRKKAKDRIYDESSLIKSLQSPRYNKYVRPLSGKNATSIQFGLSVLDIVSVREGTMEATVTFLNWVTMSWVDPRLSWDRSIYNVTNIRLPTQSLWTPDIKLFNGLDPRMDMDYKVLAVVSSDGNVLVVVPTQMDVHCRQPRDPHSNWQCTLKFGSWTYNGFDLDLQLSSNTADTAYFNNRVWDLTENTAVRHIQKYECCPEPYIDVTYTMGLLRR